MLIVHPNVRPVAPSPVQSPAALLVDLIASDPRFNLLETLGELRLQHDEASAVRRLAAVLADVVPDVLAGDAADRFTALSYRTQCRAVCWADVAWELAESIPAAAFDISRDDQRNDAEDLAADAVLARAAVAGDELAVRDFIDRRDPDTHTVGRCMAFGML